jgi:hypothetical protein
MQKMTSGDQEATLMLNEPPPQNYVPPKNDPRRVVIQKIELVFKDHQTAVLEVETPEQQANARKTPLIIKEGAEYKIRVTFRVQHQLVAGLKCVAGRAIIRICGPGDCAPRCLGNNTGER